MHFLVVILVVILVRKGVVICSLPQTHGLVVLLAQQALLTTDELRRGVEGLPGHRHMSYYHRYYHTTIFSGAIYDHTNYHTILLGSLCFRGEGSGCS